jgi:hypothetical protein
MLGFAVVDFRLKSDVVAVWLTSRITATRADHTNAVTVELEEDENALQKVHALTRDRLVVMTDGSTSAGLPIGADTLTVADISSLSSEIEAHRQRIVEAIDSYAKKTKNRSLVRPTFTDIVLPDSVVAPGEESPTQRAFQLANFVSRTWTDWLVTDDERRRRSTNPRTKKSPWIMPEHLSSSVIDELPANFRERFVPNPVEALNA